MTAPEPEQARLVITGRALAIRRSLEPTAWLVLEELAMRSTPIDGQRVAVESVRTLSAAVGRSKDAVARGVRHLVAAGLLQRVEERHGFSGQFTGGHYVIDLRAAGLRVPAAPEPALAPQPAPPAAPSTRHLPPPPDVPPAPRTRPLPPPPPDTPASTYPTTDPLF